MRWPSNLNEGIGPKTLHGGLSRCPFAPHGRFSWRQQPPRTTRRTPMAKQPRILAGQTAAITGGGRGIGRATAEAMLGQGMRVAIGDVDLETARQTASELGP